MDQLQIRGRIVVPKSYIQAWKSRAPWQLDDMVEQDLVLTRALVEIYEDSYLSSRLAFRGGTALYKLHILPAYRYSEDLDFVQIKSESIGQTIDHIKNKLNPILGEPTKNIKRSNCQLIYSFLSEQNTKLRLKIEINTREHFSIFGITKHPFQLDHPWKQSQCEISSYSLEELLGTKLRALYQRKKGRDLFDLWLGLTKGKANPVKVCESFEKHMLFQGKKITKTLFLKNLEDKFTDRIFTQDMTLLLRDGINYSVEQARSVVETQLVDLLPESKRAMKARSM